MGIRNSSHFGAGGAYALAAAEAGYLGLAVCNSDSVVRLHGGAERVHGTNPIAVAMPVAGSRPWLLDMATSAIPFNRVQLYRSLGRPLPPGTASDGDGRETTQATSAEMLAPLGDAFGFKGAGLAGLVEILSSVLTGMTLSSDLLPMFEPDRATPRELGAFVLAVRVDAFADAGRVEEGMNRYLAQLRSSRTSPGEQVMAPGDREWAEADRRARTGIPVDPDTASALAELSDTYRVRLPDPLRAGVDGHTKESNAGA